MKCTNKMKDAGLPASYWKVIRENLPNFKSDTRVSKAIRLRANTRRTSQEEQHLEDLSIQLYSLVAQAKLEGYMYKPECTKKQADAIKLAAKHNPHFKEEASFKHPLINPDSPHYETVDGKESIELIESMFSTEQLKAWALISAMKYRLRIGAKDDPAQEVRKIKTYEGYYTYLNALE